ncbi:hypothetical protein SLS60_009689 [Paraconiothyrium brasiliense]|uniref:AB hydrolase-1 domain-containing protein n=1 Tax=Paraconiothyrium brasiliense TaxID=300254 RepID=A0ABR3QVG5_9PLEO
MAAAPQEITFNTFDGIKLSALLFSAGEKRPCIIMSSGFSGLKEHFLPDFATQFQSAGYTVLVYDNRCWGSSEGTPRNHVDPQLQTRDYIDAFDFTTTLPDVDPTRIVFWGSSMSGGNVICAAAIEKRVCAVISQAPFVSGEMASQDFAAIMPLMLGERGAMRRGAPAALVPVTPETMEEAMSGTSKAILKDPGAIPFIREVDRRGYHREKMCTMQSAVALVLHEPRRNIHRIGPKPLLMVVADSDATIPTPSQLEMYNLALEPKRLYVLTGAGHFDLYYGEPFEKNISAQLNFLKEFVGS